MIYIYIYIYVHIYIHIYIYMWMKCFMICVLKYIHMIILHIYLCTFMSIYVYLCIYVYIYIYLCIYIYVYLCIFVYIYVLFYICKVLASSHTIPMIPSRWPPLRSFCRDPRMWRWLVLWDRQMCGCSGHNNWEDGCSFDHGRYCNVIKKAHVLQRFQYSLWYTHIYIYFVYKLIYILNMHLHDVSRDSGPIGDP